MTVIDFSKGKSKRTKKGGDDGEKLDQGYLADFLVADNGLIYSQKQFWQYAENKGIWQAVPDEGMLPKAEAICRQFRQGVSASSISGVIKLATGKAYQDIAWDKSGQRDICASNGVLHYAGAGQWELHPYQREDYRRVQLPVVYDPDATCPQFEKYVAQVFAGASDAAERALALIEFMGLSLTTTVEFERAMLLLGDGSNGKTKALQLIQEMVGPRYRTSIELAQMDNRFQQGLLDGKLINTVAETSTDGELPDSTVKKIISGEELTAEHKFKDAFSFYPVCKLWLATNHLPRTSDFSDGVFRRFTILTFPNKFERLKKDTKLGEKLKAETSGVLNLCLEALGRAYDRGDLTIPPSSVQALKSWRVSADQVLQFLDEAATLDPNAITPSADMYSAYTTWATEAGITRKLNRKNFTLRMGEHGIEYGTHQNVRCLFGVRPRLYSDIGGHHEP